MEEDTHDSQLEVGVGGDIFNYRVSWLQLHPSIRKVKFSGHSRFHHLYLLILNYHHRILSILFHYWMILYLTLHMSWLCLWMRWYVEGMQYIYERDKLNLEHGRVNI